MFIQKSAWYCTRGELCGLTFSKRHNLETWKDVTITKSIFTLVCFYTLCSLGSLRVSIFQMVVDEMNILTTVFLRHDNLKIRYPNSILATKPISNYNRSPDMVEKIHFSLDVSTPREKIQKMKEKIIEYGSQLLMFFLFFPSLLTRVNSITRI